MNRVVLAFRCGVAPALLAAADDRLTSDQKRRVREVVGVARRHRGSVALLESIDPAQVVVLGLLELLLECAHPVLPLTVLLVLLELLLSVPDLLLGGLHL